jgi:hypothetical protein
LQAGHPASEIVAHINQGIEKAAREKAPGAAAAYLKIAELLWNTRETGASLSVLANLDLSGPGDIPAAVLNAVSERLDSWKGLDLARAAGLLERHATSAWTRDLQNAWVRVRG